MMDERTLALHAAQALYDKKAVDLMVLDVSHLTVITDYMVICTGRTAQQVHSCLLYTSFIDFNIHGDPVDVARQQPFCNPVNCLGDIIGQATEGQAQGGNNEQQRNDFLRHSGFFLSFSFVMLNTAAVVAATLPSWRIL